MKRKFEILVATGIAVTLAGCSFSVGEPREERVANAVQEAMEERGMEVIEISFEEDADDRDLYLGEAVVRLEGDEEEIRSSCRVTVDEEQTISASDCPGITAAVRANNLEGLITDHYQGQNIEMIEVSIQGAEDGSFTGYAEVRNPRTDQPTRLNCTAQMTDDSGADWNCTQ